MKTKDIIKETDHDLLDAFALQISSGILTSCNYNDDTPFFATKKVATAIYSMAQALVDESKKRREK